MSKKMRGQVLLAAHRSGEINQASAADGSRALSAMFGVNSFRNIFAASTILASAASVSGQRRVFNPQSGFTHKRSTGISRAARRNKFAIVCTSGILGE
jgi:hypothetical protein